jgi:hypothetical protein
MWNSIRSGYGGVKGPGSVRLDPGRNVVRVNADVFADLHGRESFLSDKLVKVCRSQVDSFGRLFDLEQLIAGRIRIISAGWYREPEIESGLEAFQGAQHLGNFTLWDAVG